MRSRIIAVEVADYKLTIVSVNYILDIMNSLWPALS